jgi:uncharacterized protein HemX
MSRIYGDISPALATAIVAILVAAISGYYSLKGAKVAGKAEERRAATEEFTAVIRELRADLTRAHKRLRACEAGRIGEAERISALQAQVNNLRRTVEILEARDEGPDL